MPELPEVETIKLGLQQYVVGKTIIGVDIRLQKMFSGDAKDIIGAKIVGIRRFGKGLVIDLDNSFSMAVHVKMTGQLIYEKVSGVSKVSSVSRAGKHTHVVFKLKVQSAKFKVGEEAFLYYNDIRQFGWIKVLPTKDVLELAFFKNLGLEPFKNLSVRNFSEMLQKSKTAIKLLLMDQKKIAGIGNIYANDALYIAKIYPKRSSASLNAKEVKTLFNAIENVLKKGIDAGGASEWNYVDVLGGKGKYQNFFQVYQKHGRPCKRCGTIIEKINLGSRGTFFCPACQH